MTTDEEFKRIHERLDRHSERIHKVENMQLELASRQDAVEGTQTELVKRFNVYQNEINNNLKSMKKWMVIIGSIAAGAFVYMALKNEKAAQAVLSIGSLVTKVLPLIPA